MVLLKVSYWIYLSFVPERNQRSAQVIDLLVG